MSFESLVLIKSQYIFVLGSFGKKIYIGFPFNAINPFIKLESDSLKGNFPQSLLTQWENMLHPNVVRVVCRQFQEGNTQHLPSIFESIMSGRNVTTMISLLSFTKS